MTISSKFKAILSELWYRSFIIKGFLLLILILVLVIGALIVDDIYFKCSLFFIAACLYIKVVYY